MNISDRSFDRSFRAKKNIILEMAIRIPKDAIRVFFLCIVWYSISSTNSVVGKKLLNQFPHPTTVAFVQMLCTALFLGPTLVVWRIPKNMPISRTDLFRLIIPLSFGKALAAVSAYFSIWRIPVSYAHTIKATMPIFTVVLSRIILGSKQTKMVYCSLIPIVFGVMVSTVTELSFDLVGLMSALLATLTFSVQNIFTKKAFKELHINHLRLLYMLARISTVLLLPFWALFDLQRILTYSDLSDENILWLIIMLTITGFLNFMQNMVAFTVLSLVTPLSYSVAAATKRILVISFSLFMLRNPVTYMNVVGMSTAIFGVFLYNKAKYEANKKKDQLPLYNKDINHTNNHIVNDQHPYHLHYI